MADWRDLTVVLCMALVVLGAVALAVTARSFSLVTGKVVEKGVGVLQFEGRPRLTNTVTVLITSEDRVFGIGRGTVVQYPVTEADARALAVGSDIKFMVSSYSQTVRIIDGLPENAA
ncbi:hypothetical protein [Nitrososphaera sp.]|uniref:hypothetical protein n=1 Tax=Nitrososphaera sp. TaxID=1971748 RepID=UPI00307DCDD3